MKLDLTVEGGFIRSEGSHKVTLTDVTQSVSKKGNKVLIVTFTDQNSKTITDSYYLTEEAKWKLIELLDALQWTKEMKAIGLKKANMVGRKLIIEVEKHFNKETRKGYYEVTGVKPDLSAKVEGTESDHDASFS